MQYSAQVVIVIFLQETSISVHIPMLEFWMKTEIILKLTVNFSV